MSIILKGQYYYNDLCIKPCFIEFRDVQSLRNWTHENCYKEVLGKTEYPYVGRYYNGSQFVLGETKFYELRWNIRAESDINPFMGRDCGMWIWYASENGVIIYSSGRYTDGVKHTGKRIVEILDEIERKATETEFNFG